MKLFLVTVLLFFYSMTIKGQNSENRVSISFSEVSLEQAIEEIESKTGYLFYFDQHWITSNTYKIHGDYSNITVQELLNSILSNTDLNYYIHEKSVILTQNTIVQDKLPENYFSSERKNDVLVIHDNPVFHKDQNPLTTDKSNKISFIGKQVKNSEGKTFELSGYITQEKNGKPAADVILKTNDEKHSTITDAEGYYSIRLPVGTNNLIIESFLHKKTTRRVVLYGNGKLNIIVSENINQLSEIVVKGKKTETLKNSNTGVTSLNIEGIKNIPMVLGERDILKAATIIPGIKTAGEGSSGFNVRGGKTDQNLILLDDAIIYNPAHFFGFFSAINPFTIESADIYKGSIPSEYGGRLSSVFDITAKKPNTVKLSGEGGIGPVTSNLTVNTPIIKEKSGLLIGARATYSDWILKSLDEKSLKNSKASFYDAVLKYNHIINANNSIEATGYYSHDAFSVSSDSLYKYNNTLISLKWNHTFNPNHKAEIIATNSQYNFNIEYNNAEETQKSFDFGYKINDSQLQLKFSYAVGDKHKITYGLASKLYKIDPGYLSPSSTETTLLPITIQRENAIENGIYIADSYKITNKLLLNAGLRYSLYASIGSGTQTHYLPGLPMTEATETETREYKKNEIIKTYAGIEPRISARYFILDDLSVKASYDRTYQYLHLLSNNTTQSPTDTWKLSNLNIKPQDAHQYSLGIYKNFAESGIEMSIEGYLKKINNLLDYKVGADLLLNDHIETELLNGNGKAHGVEFMIKKETGKLNGWLGYTYSRTFIKLDSEFESNRVNNGEYFPANYDKPHDLSAILNYKLTKRYSISTNFIYQTGRPITYPIGKYVYGNSEYTLYSDRNKFRIPDYYRLDIGVNIEGNHKIKKLAHSFWNISVYNVLGRNNPYSIFFVTKEGEIKAYKTSIFSVPVPTISYNFKF